MAAGALAIAPEQGGPVSHLKKVQVAPKWPRGSLLEESEDQEMDLLVNAQREARGESSRDLWCQAQVARRFAFSSMLLAGSALQRLSLPSPQALQ